MESHTHYCSSIFIFQSSVVCGLSRVTVFCCSLESDCSSSSICLPHLTHGLSFSPAVKGSIDGSIAPLWAPAAGRVPAGVKLHPTSDRWTAGRRISHSSGDRSTSVTEDSGSEVICSCDLNDRSAVYRFVNSLMKSRFY